MLKPIIQLCYLSIDTRTMRSFNLYAVNFNVMRLEHLTEQLYHIAVAAATRGYCVGGRLL